MLNNPNLVMYNWHIEVEHCINELSISTGR